jgi:OOP family OmpA-OmpF porin
MMEKGGIEMKRQFLTAAIAVLVWALIFSGSTVAEIREGSFSVSPQLGGYLFEGNQDLENGFTFGLGGGYNFTRNLGAEFFLNYINTESETTGQDVDGYLYRLDGLYHFMPESKLVPYIATGFGGITLDPDAGSNDTSFSVNYGGGVKYFLSETIALRGDIRHVISFDDTYNNLIYTLGVDFLFGGQKKPEPAVVMPVVVAAPPPPEPDSDGDGVVDSKDKCPGTPKGVSVDSSGCPLDSDGDGVYDYLDKCPDTPKGVAVNSSGCPPDTDGDGVYDYLDKCPGTPKGVTVNSSGCPLDTDGDGVYDYLDKCPGTPKDAPVDSSGCPLDTDMDGVYDYLDKCEGTPRDLKVDKDGCPVLEKKTATIDLDIQFDSNKADIKPQYHGKLMEVADFMAAYPETKAVIEGHTDSLGSAAYNQKLSQQRAESIRDYLIRNFKISPNRLTAKGFGEERPVASNDTEEGRRKNRRIQAVISTETETFQKR